MSAKNHDTNKLSNDDPLNDKAQSKHLQALNSVDAYSKLAQQLLESERKMRDFGKPFPTQAVDLQSLKQRELGALRVAMRERSEDNSPSSNGNVTTFPLATKESDVVTRNTKHSESDKKDR